VGQRVEILEVGPVPTQSYLGVYTQPLSFVGLPVLAAPVPTDGLPIGVQLVAAPDNEAALLAAAAALEARGVVAAHPVPRREEPTGRYAASSARSSAGEGTG
jgi:aspartyl-tRNA(Asn)/glutamyl-tRNA(Gln) amidotransferase subunit A